MFAPRCDVAGNTERCSQKTLQQKMEYRDFWTWRAYRDTNRESFWSARFEEHHGMPGKQYWLRVQRHLEQGALARYGYFSGVELQSVPPMVCLVAPGLRFQPATGMLRYLSLQAEVARVGPVRIVETRMVRSVTPVNSCIWLPFSGNHCRSGGI
jgi:hypothetical protein